MIEYRGPGIMLQHCLQKFVAEEMPEGTYLSVETSYDVGSDYITVRGRFDLGSFTEHFTIRGEDAPGQLFAARERLMQRMMP